MSKTDSYLAVAVALLAEPEADHWAVDLRSSLRMRSGALYPILWEMLEEGYLEDGWSEDRGRAPKGRPRRFYRLTQDGKHELAAAAKAAQRAPRRSREYRPALAR